MITFDTAASTGEVQALVRTGFGWMPYCRYYLLEVTDCALARERLKQLVDSDGMQFAAQFPSRAPRDDAPGPVTKTPVQSVQIAFTYHGLIAMGLRETEQRPFPTAYSMGMSSLERAGLLGDPDPGGWEWNDGRTHVLLACFSTMPFDEASAMPLIDGVTGPSGMVLLKVVETCPYYVNAGTEPFGFKDGLSQPRIEGLHDVRESDPNAVAPGEILLGHVNVYGERAYCPDVQGFRECFTESPGFGYNGSFIAVRQIRQDVPAFDAFRKQWRAQSATGGVSLVERMMRRREGGDPILACPAEQTGNDFLFRLDDSEGFHCPRGSHVRRANPRDVLAWDRESGVFASRLHRILRRGRAYRGAAACADAGQRCASESAACGGCGQGLFFMALNADIERQFEFIQGRWLANNKFADLWDEDDPILGRAGRSFSTAGFEPVGSRHANLPAFTEVIGGGYFFLPSRSALRFIAGLRG